MRDGFWLGAMLAVACTGGDRPGDGGQFGEEVSASCVVDRTTQLALDELSPLGFAPQAVLDLVEASYEHELSWIQQGAVTTVQVEVTPLGTASFVEQVVEREDGFGGPEPFCPNYVAVDVQLALTTEDGQLAESFTVALSAETAESASFFKNAEDLQGSFDPWQHLPEDSDFDEVRAWLSISFGAAGLSGQIDGQGSGVEGDPDDPDSMAYAQNFEIASFGVASE